jgi:hypothetical protein
MYTPDQYRGSKSKFMLSYFRSQLSSQNSSQGHAQTRAVLASVGACAGGPGGAGALLYAGPIDWGDKCS